MDLEDLARVTRVRVQVPDPPAGHAVRFGKGEDPQDVRAGRGQLRRAVVGLFAVNEVFVRLVDDEKQPVALGQLEEGERLGLGEDGTGRVIGITVEDGAAASRETVLKGVKVKGEV